MTITTPPDYWDPLWASGRRYRGLGPEEQQMTRHILGAGHGRPALDIGCGDRALTQYLHADLGNRTTAIDCSSAALKIAQAEQNANDGPVFRQLDIETNDTSVLPDAGYALVTCRLVFAFIKDKPASSTASDASSRPAEPSGWSPLLLNASRRNGNRSESPRSRRKY